MFYLLINWYRLKAVTALTPELGDVKSEGHRLSGSVFKLKRNDFPLSVPIMVGCRFQYLYRVSRKKYVYAF